MTEIRELWERLEVAMETRRVIEACRFAADALRYIAEDARTLPAARSTAEGAILGMAKALEREATTQESAAELEDLANLLNEAWELLRHVPGGSGAAGDACLEAARLLRPVDRSRSVAVEGEQP